MTNFKVGDLVRIKDSEIDDYTRPIQSKIRDRTGEVTGFSYPNQYPLVTFHASGRRKEFRFGIVHPSRLEIARNEE